MSTGEKKVCPTCQGTKIIAGVCEGSSEWSGAAGGDDFVDDMQCTPDQECPTCKGTGYEIQE